MFACQRFQPVHIQTRKNHRTIWPKASSSHFQEISVSSPVQIEKDAAPPLTVQSECHIQTRFADVHSRSSFKGLPRQPRKGRQNVLSVCIGGWTLKPLGLINCVQWKASSAAESEKNRIQLSRPRIIIPKTIRPEVIARSHSSHLGIEPCSWKARDSVFLPGMSSEIKEAVSQCSVCAEFQTWNWPQRAHAAVLVDYYSDVVELSPRSSLQDHSTIIHFLKEQFSRHEIPDVLVSDNGPEFKHVRSFPHHHKANGKAESAVKITRNLFKKALRDSRDPRLVLLEYRNTAVETIGSSPAQRLVPRRTKTLIPTASTLLRLKLSKVLKSWKGGKQRAITIGRRTHNHNWKSDNGTELASWNPCWTAIRQILSGENWER